MDEGVEMKRTFCITVPVAIVVLVLALASSSAAAAGAYAFETRPVSAVVAEGCVLPTGFIELVPTTGGVAGIYEEGGVRIRFEARRGPETPRVLRLSDPETPLFEVDVRFLDERGGTLLLQVGGHAPVDPTWSTSFEATRESGGEADERIRSRFAVAAAVVEKLRWVRFRAGLAPEYHALLGMGPLIESARAIDSALDPALPRSSCTYRNKIQIHDKSCCLWLGRHGATIAKNISPSGVTTQAWATCNHGTCAQNMALKCQGTSPADRCELSSTAPMCSTPYNAFSFSGTHNSNDDTDIQYESVRYAYTPDPQLGTCRDSSRNDQPTNCY